MTTLLPVVRVVDALHPARTPRILQGVDVVLEHHIRRTVMLPASVPGLATLDRGTSGALYRTTFLPSMAAGLGLVRIVRNAVIGGRKVALAPVTADLAKGMPTIAVVPMETPQASVSLALHAVMQKLASVETDPFTVPPGAELRFDVGVDSPGPRQPVGVGARISVVDDHGARTVWRARLPGADGAWHAARTSLAAFAGHTIRLRFTTHPGTRAGDAGMLALFGEPVVLAPRRRPAAPFNVVLVSMDALRARSVGVYGCVRPTTPTLDALAADGVLFENAFSTAAFTLPGHLSMLTGLWFRTHGAMAITSVLSPEHRTLAEALRSAGYATGAFTSGAWIVPWAGFRRGFDEYFELKAEARLPSDEPFRRGVDWMRANVDRPFFAFLHDYVVHAAYQPPPPYSTMFEALPEGAPEAEQKRRAYEQEVRYGDDQIRGLLEGIRALGVADRTLVIVTADHGEQFGEHGGFEHTYDLHDEVARVPLIMRLPGAIPPGARIAEPASLADLVPTIVDLLGLPPVDGVDGMSLLPLIAGTAAQLPRGGVFSEAASDPSVSWADVVAVHTRTVSCIDYAQRHTQECYDRRVDPWQRFAPLPSDDASAAVAEAKVLLARFAGSKPPPGAAPETPPPTTAPVAPDVEAERREQLRALGYVQ